MAANMFLVGYAYQLGAVPLSAAAIEKAIEVGGLGARPCRTETLRLHGYEVGVHPVDAWLSYGTDRQEMNGWIAKHPDWKLLLHPRLPYTAVEVVWAVREEMARTLDDVLSRRLRALFLNAKAASEMAPAVARIMAGELGFGHDWIEAEVASFLKFAKKYQIV